MLTGQATIVVVPRERFSLTRAALRSVCDNTPAPFELVYVDGGSPGNIRRYLESVAAERGFRIVRMNSYLSPNRARNIGLAHVSTKYVVFLDNDVLVAPGWLTALVECAEETGAAAVTPLTLECFNRGSIVVHHAGGECRIAEEKGSGPPQRHLVEAMHCAGQPPEVVRADARRKPTEYAEFHCLLVRTDVMRRVGPFDEQFLNTKDHVDFCLLLAEAGGVIYFEPSSVVTFVHGQPLAWSDVPFFLLRWNDEWERASLDRLRAKWKLSEDDYFRRRYGNLGWRRKDVVERAVRTLTLGVNLRWLERPLIAAERALNRRYARHYRGED